MVHPKFDEWLAANQGPLTLLEEASTRSRFYVPVVATEQLPLVITQGIALGWIRPAIELIAVRAALEGQRKQFDASASDVLRVHRLARLVAQEPSLMGSLLGILLDGEAVGTGLALGVEPDLPRATARTLLDGLVQLPRLPEPVEAMDNFERYFMLDAVCFVYRTVRGGKPQYGLPQSGASPENVDWNLALREANAYWDLIIQAQRLRGDARTAAIAASKACAVYPLPISRMDKFKPALYWLGGWACRTAQSRFVAKMVGMVTVQAFDNVSEKANGDMTLFELEKAVLALRVFRNDKGRWPQELKELVPEYLPEVSQDRNVGRPLVYQPRADGFLLYSTGMNGNDENGKGDDRAIEFPLPPEPAGSTGKPAAKPSRR